MYRKDTYQRIFSLINDLKKQQHTSKDLLTRLELANRIDNLKSILQIIRSTP